MIFYMDNNIKISGKGIRCFSDITATAYLNLQSFTNAGRNLNGALYALP